MRSTGISLQAATARPSASPSGSRRRHRRPRPALGRLARIGRLTLHFLRGLRTVAFTFPSLDAQARRVRIRKWSRKLLRILHVELRVQGELLHPNVQVVANHVSWLDIFALHAIGPVRFIAKSEIGDWPMIGRLVRGVGTLFVERARRRDTHRVNREVTDALAAGDIVAVFPEGTVTDGSKVLPFKGSLLQPIIDVRGRIQPVAIAYRDAGGERSRAAVYQDVHFLGSLWRIAGARSLVVELVALPPLDTAGRHRRELAREAEIAIRAALASPARGSAPGTLSGLAGESR
jgi:1-acyl-sn-glycerol-3-phosphate acyltransferase